jgi:Flagellar biosynthesis protein, FliO
MMLIRAAAVVTTLDEMLMDRGDGMRVLRSASQRKFNDAATTADPEVQGLAGWVFGLVRGWRGQREIQRRQLCLVETLPLGGKRQLMLVTCAGESFLVGGGMESVETIVRLKAEVSLDVVAKSLDGTCQ